MGVSHRLLVSLIATTALVQLSPRSLDAATEEPRQTEVTVPTLQQYARKRQGLGLLTGRTLYVRNNSEQAITLRLLDVRTASGWQSVVLPPASEYEVRLGSLWVAVATGENTPDLKDLSATNTVALDKDGSVVGMSFVRQLQDQRRYEICWSSRLMRWVMQDLRETLCP
ncbi:hypothetical protein C8R32_10265 [Nitrosospira sp. Nsp5]|uniref:Uncharacterized protein n=1 Tax=Nitrosospira multiformis TaxID=1231 RepID=A0ABY0TL33_9PROT|nr:hypothetical protein C8R32_10265 [Nitrosospira sp. Nsp5]SDR00036.1 hypothetical protein SAMN05216402_3193 [Nitrosospira multiformis]